MRRMGERQSFRCEWDASLGERVLCNSSQAVM